jgi:hypothetical protein
MLDCDKHCNDILIKMRYNIIQRTKIEVNSKDRLTASIIKKNKQLADDYEKLSDELQLCIADCKRRNRDSELAGSENKDVHPIDGKLKTELSQLDSDDDTDDDLSGGNKRRRRRRSFRNKTKRTQRLRSRRRQKHRNQRRNTRRVK